MDKGKHHIVKYLINWRDIGNILVYESSKTYLIEDK